MKHYVYICIVVGLCLMCLCCKEKDDDKAMDMISDIEQSVAAGDFRSALDSIVILRDRYPNAINARKRALELWQEASLAEAEYEARQTDSLLQITLRAIDSVPTLLEQNMMRNRRDSLQARYDAEVGVIKIIRAKRDAKE